MSSHLINTTDYIDFKALGYKGDPIIHGGRFKKLPMGYSARGGEVKPMIQVGKKVPDFVAPAYQQGKFVSVKLSEYLGKWVLLCFYPGDFTFV
jgi:hypothetical protein